MISDKEIESLHDYNERMELEKGSYQRQRAKPQGQRAKGSDQAK